MDIFRNPPLWVAEYIGIPFVNRGRDRAGVDCWGLVHIVYKEVFEIDIPSYTEFYKDWRQCKHLGALIEKNLPNWEIINDKGQVGDVRLITVKGYPSHVGIVVARNKMLHIEKNINASLEEFGTPLSSYMNGHTYRFKGLKK